MANDSRIRVFKQEDGTFDVIISTNKDASGNVITGQTFQVDGSDAQQGGTAIPFLNYFSAVTEGAHTASIITSSETENIPFNVGDDYVTKLDPVANVSIANSVRFADSSLENVEAALWDKQDFTSRQHAPFVYKFQSDDSIKIQYNTNYENQQVKIYDGNGNELGDLVQTKQSENINSEIENVSLAVTEHDGRVAFRLTDSSIKIVGSNIYKIGTRVTSSDATLLERTYEIVSIVYDDVLEQFLMVTDVVDSISASLVICDFQYDAESYEIYEFDIDFSTYENREIYVGIEFTDDNEAYPDSTWESELIQVKESFVDSVLIEWEDTLGKNIRQIDSSTGITHMMRMNASFLPNGRDRETDSFEDDDNVTVRVDQSSNDIMVLTAVAPPFIDKMMDVINEHASIKIRGVDYVPNAEIESEYNPDDQVALAVIRATYQPGFPPT